MRDFTGRNIGVPVIDNFDAENGCVIDGGLAYISRLAINNNLSPVPAYGVNPTICRFVPSFDILRAKLEATVHPILGGSCSTVTAEGSTAGKVCVAKAWQKRWTTSADI